ncbi:MAG: glycosyltransferase [Anaerolineae bacterium]|nr:glycosyltransferase [Chloroflexota bacterium]MBP6298699.1 glycosyltransferase [Anaerolineae bacterium]
MSDGRLRSLAIISMHTSPLAPLGGYKTGGMNVYVRELARELGRRGILVDIFTRRESESQAAIDDSIGEHVHVVHISAGGLGVVDPNTLISHTQEFAGGIHKYATRYNRGYDAIYAHYWLSGKAAEVLRRSWNIPLVQMFHTLGAMKNRIAYQPMIDPRVIGEMEIIRTADRLIAATQAEYAQLLWLYRADRRKVSIVPPGVDAGRFAPLPKKQARDAVGLRDGERMLLFVGRLEPLKAVDTIVAAVGMIHALEAELLHGVRFTIVGGSATDPERRKLIAMGEQLGVSAYLDFVGSRDHTQLPYYYSAAEALLMPSDYESFGMVALEAMTSGTPVIASGVGGLQYLVREGETGFLIPVRDAEALAQRVRDLLHAPSERDRMGANAAELARKYDWPIIADRLIAVLADAMLLRRQQANSGNPGG